MMQPATNDGGFGRRVVAHLKKRLMTGLLIIVPVGITIFILKFLFNFADGFLGPTLARLLNAFRDESEYVPGFGVVAGLIVIYLTGLFAGNLIGRRLVLLWDDLLGRIPLVKSIYSSSKQVTNVFSGGSDSSQRRAVIVEFPAPGAYAVAFQTGVVSLDGGGHLLSVYVPTAPNPTSGYVLYIEPQKVYPAPFGIEEAMKIVVSGGVVTPGRISLHRGER